MSLFHAVKSWRMCCAILILPLNVDIFSTFIKYIKTWKAFSHCLLELDLVVLEPPQNGCLISSTQKVTQTLFQLFY